MKSARKIASIALVVLSALLVFVGCEQTPLFEMPQSIKSGVITQDGEFLEGQAFDPSKFTVEVVYDNGKTDSFPGASIVTWTPSEEAQSGVKSGDSLKAKVGLDSGNVSYTVDGVLYAAKIDTLTVVPATTSYAVNDWSELDIPSTDVAVTATFTGRDGEVATVVLKPSEYDVEVVDSSTLNTPSALNPSVNAVAKVTTNVGGNVEATYAIEGTFEAADVDFAFNEIESVKLRTAGTLLGFGDAVADFALFDIKVSDGTNTETLTADPGLELSFVNAEHRAVTDLSKETNVIVKAEYEGCETYYSEPITVTVVTLDANSSSDSTVKFYKGEALPEIAASDYEVTYSYGDQTRYVDSSDVEFAYSTEQNTVKAPADGVVPENGSLYVIATYRGISDDVSLTTETRKYEAVYAPAEQSATVDQVVLAGTYEAPKAQNYTDFETALELDETAVDSVSYMYTAARKDAKPVVRVVPKDDLGGRIDVKYTTDTKGTALVAGPDALVGLDTIYIEVTYTPISGTEIVYYEPVKLQTAYATKLVAEVKYTGNLNADDEPMFGANVDVTVNAENENGIVIADIQDYVIVDSATKRPVEAFVSTVDMAEHSYTLNAIVAGEDGETQITTEEDVTISAGEAYYAVTELGIEPAELEGEETAPVYLIDEKLTLEAADFVVTGYTGQGTEAPLTITGFVYTSENVTEGENTVYAKVSYTDESGKTVNELVEFTVEGTSWGEVSGAQLIWADTKEPVTTIEAGTYNIDDFAIKGYTEHGTSPVKISVYAAKDASVTESGNFAVGAYETISFRYSYTDKTGETVGPTQVLEVSATPAN